ncbi:MAG: hypothetical protein KUA43_18090 [Hoeflea sp.]|uniref:DUF6074 family protein n=1 Tax=Hoeflea sp. TaxID=1940281 RepID=UPI001D79C832|nr:DUF6074 family protein [Hoeflea sp.]MBU4529187.1 hypothetical protein [Alphaproteobacteria bacterium]MBU4543592.1 hypothetical protein [Alphaproteobacteria bacterium]MBU4549217.1 hypothetical protein [Alphaproteobacteria bacterium]MBV1725351.1 hypothetical protein [Hoeflea sp.]MBV1785313.1 hypothetical protein [Hoeflea sp.]
MKQLDLFNQPEVKTMAEIIAFPVDREIAFVRETARVLTIKHGAAADRFWQVTCRRLYARLQVQGMAHDSIRDEVNAFAEAVYAEVRRQHPTIWPNSDNPKGAA